MEPFVQKVSTDMLSPNPWNTNIVSPENQLKIEESVKRFGMFKPLVCRTLENGDIEIIGGQHRWEAAIALGIKTVNIVNLGFIDDQKAKEISLVDNGRYGADDGLKLADLLKEIGDVSSFMPYSEAELTHIMSAAEVNLDALDFDETDEELDKRVEELTSRVQTYQVMRFKVPISDAEFVQGVIDGISQRQGFTSSDSLTNAGDALVWLCGRTKDEA